MSSVIINKIKRFSVVILLKRFLPLLLLISFFFISILLGIWNIQRFVYSNDNFELVSKEDVSNSLKQYLGKNIFLIKPFDIKESVLQSSGYVKSVYVKKNIPNTIFLTLQEYDVGYIAYYGNICSFFSTEGIYLEKKCEQCEQECRGYVLNEDTVYIYSDTVLESGKRLIFIQEFDIISKVLREFGYIPSNINMNLGITTFTDIQGHTFVFDLADDLNTQLGRLYLVGEKINVDQISFKSVDLRFERPVMLIE